MIFYLLWSLCIIVTDTFHFDGGTIRWMPADPYDKSSSVTIIIIQSYSWTYPTISCTTNVPISTAGRSTQNSNLTCVVDCSTDGGYSTNPISILTDCTSMSSSLSMMTSQRAVNITLTSNANFYLAFVGSAWVALNNPAQAGLQWSIVSFVDLRIRSDGFINTPPVASIVSPQYVIVNRTTQIQIPTSDVNTGDDVRCRWSKYTPGYRRRKRSEEEQYTRYEKSAEIYEKVPANEETVHNRRRRGGWPLTCANCNNTCILNCPCTCAVCAGTTCSGNKCNNKPTCLAGTTTVETPGTLKPTSSYPQRQPIDECGGICYPSAVPNGTTLSNCTVSFTGLVSNTWYAIAIQVEDFINGTSLTPMSSVPVQFLIYVMPEPGCSVSPIIIPLQGCLEVTVGVFISFNLSALNLCDPANTSLTDIFLSTQITGIEGNTVTSSPSNASLVYATFTWTPQISQLGAQQLCAIAYTSDLVQSIEYCVTFKVTTSSNLCSTTTTTSTSTFLSMITSMASTTPTNIMPVATSTMTTAATTSDTAGKDLFWGLIGSLSALGLVLLVTLLCFCCLYWLLWSPAANRRIQEEEENEGRHSVPYSNTESMPQSILATTRVFQIEMPKKSYQVYDIPRKANNTKTSYMIIKDTANTSTTSKWSPSHVPTTDQNWSIEHFQVPMQPHAQN